mmetsp:Transcript_1521/g.2172  ORF Transcript_1521/g.2172 Transcript_1521/m.2172 type:complete len:113 (+) Transcript_1521:105-443(+)
MGRPYKEYLDGNKIFCCSNCRAHAADNDDIMSKAFTGRHGRAYLMKRVVNVSVGTREDRELLTGYHTIADIYCNICESYLGWKYERAYEINQRYKEGHYILERELIIKEGDW